MSKQKKGGKYESGQALVLILLSLSVVLTIVLFILSRSITDITTSTGQSDSVRAFSAAEAGVENALITGAGAFNITVGDASYSVTVSDASKDESGFAYPTALLSGDSMTLWFVSHNDQGDILDSDGNLFCGTGYPCFTGDTIKVCWGNPNTSSSLDLTPAIEASVYYEDVPGDFSSVKIARGVFDPNTTRTSRNSFLSSDSGTCQINGTSYAFQKTISLSSLGVTTYNTAGGLLFAKFRMIYNSDVGHLIGVDTNFSGNSLLPSQGKDITSTGSSGGGESQSNRKVVVFKGWPEFPLSGLSLFSPYGLTK